MSKPREMSHSKTGALGMSSTNMVYSLIVKVSGQSALDQHGRDSWCQNPFRFRRSGAIGIPTGGQ